MIHIICIKFGNKFSSEYVNKLFRGVSRNTSKEFLFTCYTENTEGIDEGINCEPLPMQTGDWYSKIGLYNQNLYNPEHQIFYFDLDTVIIGNLDDIFEYRGNFAIVRDFYRSNGLQSCFMSWRPHAVNHMFQNYRGQKSRYGDQGWCEEQYPGADIWQEMYPNQVASYKVHLRDKNARHNRITDISDIRVLCFHGRPMIHEVPQYWNLYAK